MGAQHCPLWLAYPAGAACRRGGGGPSPGGVACHRCEGPLVSGTVPPPAARPLGRAARVPRPVCPGCGRIGCEDPARAPQRAPLRAGVARCGGGRRASPGGGAFRRCEGRLRSGAPPPPAARPLGGLSGSATHVLWARVRGCGGPALSAWLASPVGAACRGGDGGPSSRGVACHRCEGRLLSGAVPLPTARPLGRAAGVSATRVSRVRLVWAWGPGTCPTACALAGRRCALWGRRKGVPGGGAFRRCEGRLRSGAPPPTTARPPGGLSGSATHVLWARVRGCGGPALSAWLASPVGAACRGGDGGPSSRGVACHHCEGRLLSGAVPLPTARPLGRAAGVSATRVSRVRLVWAWGPGTCPTACALAGRRCALWGRRKGVPGGGAFRRCEGRLRSGAPPPTTARPPGGLSGSATHLLWARVCGCGGPALAPWLACPVGGCARLGWRGASGFRRPPFPGCPPSGRAAGARWPRAVHAGLGVCFVCGVCVVRALVRGVAFRSSLWCPPLRCFVAVLCSPCVCRSPFPARE